MPTERTRKRASVVARSRPGRKAQHGAPTHARAGAGRIPDSPPDPSLTTARTACSLCCHFGKYYAVVRKLPSG